MFHFFHKTVQIEWNLRQIDQIRSFAVTVSGKCGGGCQPAGVASHDLNNADGRFGCSEAGVVPDDLFHGCGDIFGGGAITRGMICKRQIIVDSFRNAHEFLRLIFFGGIIRQHLNSIHGVVSANIKKIFDIVLFHDLEHSVIDIFVALDRRKLITAGTEKSGRRPF